MKDLEDDYSEVVDTLWKHGYSSPYWVAGFITCAKTFGVSIKNIIEHIVSAGIFEGPTWSQVQRYTENRGEFSVVKRRSVRDGTIDLEALAVDLHSVHDQLVSKLNMILEGPLDAKELNQISSAISALNRNVESIDKLVRDKKELLLNAKNINILQIQQGVESLVGDEHKDALRKFLREHSRKSDMVIDVENKA